MRKTVLIVEDDAAVAELLRDVLEAEGFDVLIEPDGEWGLRTFEAKPIDLLIVDLLLPKVKGFDLIDRARKLPRGGEVPIVVVSGVYRSTAFRDEMIQKHRIAEYLDKPVDLDHLIDTLHDLFSSAYPEPRITGEHRISVLPDVKKAAIDTSSLHTLLDVPDKGDLVVIPFASVLGKLYRLRASGALMLRKASVKKIVYLKEGIPVFVKSNLLSECLGPIMVQERLISQEECDESLARKKKEKRRQGDILVEMGSISPHNLEFALELQMQIKLFDLFTWLDGLYQFNDHADYNATQIALPMAPTAMIYEGASRAMSNDRIARELAKLSTAKVVPSGDPTFRYQTLQLDPRADRLVDRIDGSRTLGELLDAAEFDRSDAALLLYALCCTGLVQTTDEVSVPEPIALEEGDVEVLSTGEINAIAELAKVGPSWENLEALFDASAEEVLDPVTEPPAPPPLESDRWAEPPPAMLLGGDDDDDVEEPLEGATEEAFSTDDVPALPAVGAERAEAGGRALPDRDPLGDDVGDTFQSDPALPDQPRERILPRASSLPRAPRWTPRHAMLDSIPEDGANDSAAPALSNELRMQVRERLEAHVARIAEIRASERPQPGAPVTKKFPTKPSAAGTYRMRAAPKDLEKERKLEAELTQRLTAMERQTYYELLEVAEDARVEVIRTAYHALARKHDPERITGQSTSRVVHKKAEQIYLLLTRALSTLTSDGARAEYDRKLGIRQPKRADLIAADVAFEEGLEAAAREDWNAASRLFERAVQLHREDGVYLAHLAWAQYHGDGGGGRALELLDRAAEQSPRAEEVYLFAAQIHDEAGRKAEAVRAYQRALVCNPDCVVALDRLKVLDPPNHKRSGLLSRLNLS